MSLNPLFVIAPSLQEYFVDKDTGEALAAGVVTFYKDDERALSGLKPVYQISATPAGVTTYAELPNPCILSSVGTFMDDNGNDIIPYYFPYEGTPEDTTGIVELYYITVYSSGGVLQFTREAWPNMTGNNAGNSNELINYIPNGQFLLHNDHPTTATVGSNLVRYIAQGGWTYEENTSPTATTTVSFIRNDAPQDNPNVSADPRYSVQVACTVAGTDTIKDLRLKFPDVNKFAGTSSEDSSIYTLSFQGLATTGNKVVADVRLIKNFGTGGSPSSSTDQSLGLVEIQPSQGIYNLSFTFGDNLLFDLGTNDDDYLQIALRFPTSSIFTVRLSDFLLTPGEISVTAFPQTPNNDFISQSTAGWLPTPNPDGSDLYLSVMLTPQGMIFDDSEIGKIVGKMSTASNNELLCDGSMYITSDYSTLGIPYSRLQAKIFDNDVNLPYFGTGENFVQAFVPSGQQSDIILCTNKLGAQTHPSDGSVPTGFNFSPVTNNTNPGSVGYNYQSGSNGNARVVFISNFTAGTNGTNPFAAGTSGMSFTNLSSPTNLGIHYEATTTALSAATLAAGAATPGKYFTFSDSGTNYYVWFAVSTETDPAPGGTPVKTSLADYMNANDVGNIIRCVLAGYQTDILRCISGASVPAGSWFQFFSNGDKYVVWYEVNGAGTEPVVVSTEAYIKVTLTGSETTEQVAAKTQTALNNYSFAVPDLRGKVLRGIESSAYWDLAQIIRFTPQGVGIPANPGSLEVDLYATTGGTESRMVNTYVNWYIKY